LNNLAPIALFVYNRPWHTQQTVEALQRNTLAIESEIFIFSDAPKNEKAVDNVNDVRKYIQTIDTFKKVTIIERDENWGLAKSIIQGVTEIINEYGKIIVLEDDLITSEQFLAYMNMALKQYEESDSIFSITAFSFSENFLNIPKGYTEKIYLHPRPMSWSWATWKNRWEICDWEISDYKYLKQDNYFINQFKRIGPDLPKMLELQMNKKIDSWYVRFCYSAYKSRMLTVYPINSLISNIGHDGTGVHCTVDESNKYTNSFNNPIQQVDELFLPEEIHLNEKIVSRFNKNFIPKNIMIRVFRKLLTKLKK
jgi:hypothetical protein